MYDLSTKYNYALLQRYLRNMAEKLPEVENF